MTEIEQLNANIREAEQAAKDAGRDAARAESEYQEAIASGDIAAAESTLQRQAEAERMQKIQSDRAQALEAGRRQAEAADYGPVADEATERARIAVEVEAQAFDKLAEALEAVDAAAEAARQAISTADTACAEASSTAKKAHRPMPDIGRFPARDTASLLHGLRARWRHLNDVQEQSIRRAGVIYEHS